MTPDGRTPPHDIYAEQAVLGAMLLDPATINAATLKVREDDFYRPEHRAVFRAILAVRGDGDRADAITIGHALATTGELPGIGGASFLHTLVDAVPTVAEASTYARIVAEIGHLRRTIDVGHRIVELGYDGIDAAKASALAEELVGEARGAAPDAHLTSRLVLGGGFALDARKGVPAVWGDGDQVVWPEGEPLLLCGPDGVGKTTIAQRLTLARIGLLDTVLGMPVASGNRRTLYLACDRPAQARRSFNRMVSEAHRDHLDNTLVVWEGPPPEDFGKTPGALYELCRLADADTVIIDSERDVAVKLTDDEVGQNLNRAHQLCVANSVQVLGLHHQRKASTGGEKPKTLADVYGSRWIVAGCGSVVMLWGDPGDHIVEWNHRKPPAAEVGPFKILLDHRAGDVRIHNPTDLLQLARNSNDGISADEAAAVLFDTAKPTPNQREKARYKLETLASKTLLHRTAGGRSPDGKQAPVRYVAVTLLHGGAA
jgi:replicative DNA helicase